MTSVAHWIVVGVAGFCLVLLLLTDRWGHFIGTHNWRASRRMDRQWQSREEAMAVADAAEKEPHRDH